MLGWSVAVWDQKVNDQRLASIGKKGRERERGGNEPGRLTNRTSSCLLLPMLRKPNQTLQCFLSLICLNASNFGKPVNWPILFFYFKGKNDFVEFIVSKLYLLGSSSCVVRLLCTNSCTYVVKHVCLLFLRIVGSILVGTALVAVLTKYLSIEWLPSCYTDWTHTVLTTQGFFNVLIETARTVQSNSTVGRRRGERRMMFQMGQTRTKNGHKKLWQINRRNLAACDYEELPNTNQFREYLIKQQQ